MIVFSFLSQFSMLKIKVIFMQFFFSDYKINRATFISTLLICFILIKTLLFKNVPKFSWTQTKRLTRYQKILPRMFIWCKNPLKFTPITMYVFPSLASRYWRGNCYICSPISPFPIIFFHNKKNWKFLLWNYNFLFENFEN